ncbi:molybdenum ABC transporter ATP-binding protein [Mycobacterium sp. 1274756.6]|nr:molybdenum ABC transporter ATP-binding protein [Mycobacterium sp. 1274756.6]
MEVRATVAERGLAVAFGVPAGQVLAIVGPNGAGKSTALHVIAGLVRPDAGLVRVRERVLTDTAAGTQVATHDRRVGLLLQNPLLFPHLSVAANVAFGPRCRGGRGSVTAIARRWLREVDAEALADRKPRRLSGGQAQRVAIARALAAEPEVLLLDEPLAGLDVAAASAARAVLRRAVTGARTATVLITHDLLDVVSMADRILVLEGGAVAECGPVSEVLAAPRSAFGALLAGVNLVAGTVAADGLLHAADGTAWHGFGSVGAGQAGVAVFAPAAVAVFAQPPQGSPRNLVAVTVAELDTRGPVVRVRGREQADGTPGLAADITAEAAAQLGLASGQRVWFGVKAHEVAIHPSARHTDG